MNNRCLLLLALLAANRRFGQPPVLRTVVVKQAFLAETLRPLYHYWRQTFRFARYYHGPYTEDIFHRLGVLLCNGLVRVERSSRRGGKEHAEYNATDAGMALVERFRDFELVQLADDIVWALQTVGVEQAWSICKLVYEESEFAQLLQEHSDKGIGPESRVPLAPVTAAGNTTLETLLILQQLSQKSFDTDTTVTPREMVRAYISILAERATADVTPDIFAA